MPFRIAAAAVLATAAAVSAAHASSQLERGAALYRENCAACHGDDGRGGAGFSTPIIGPGNMLSKFGTAQGLFEYNQLLMPFDDPAKMTDEQKWDVVAYMMRRNGWLEEGAELDPARAGSVAIAGR